MSHQINITRIKSIHNQLSKTNVKFAFVGGATVSLYAQRETDDIRPTDDIDVVVEIASYDSEYTALTEQLHDLGFTPDTDSTVICRYLHKGFIIDIMPIEADVLGFTNRWYKAGLSNAITYEIDEHHKVNIFSPPYFIASKLEAFKNRGKNDGRTSSDFEDIVFVLNNRGTIWSEIKDAEPELSMYIIDEFKALMTNPYIEEWIHCHDIHNLDAATTIIEHMRQVIQQQI